MILATFRFLGLAKSGAVTRLQLHSKGPAWVRGSGLVSHFPCCREKNLRYRNGGLLDPLKHGTECQNWHKLAPKPSLQLAKCMGIFNGFIGWFALFYWWNSVGAIPIIRSGRRICASRFHASCAWDLSFVIGRERRIQDTRGEARDRPCKRPISTSHIWQNTKMHCIRSMRRAPFRMCC